MSLCFLSQIRNERMKRCGCTYILIASTFFSMCESFLLQHRMDVVDTSRLHSYSSIDRYVFITPKAVQGVRRLPASRLLQSTKMVTESQPAKHPFGRDSTVLVVGASRGLGFEFVRQLLSKGSYVLGTYRGQQAPKELKNLESTSSGRLQLVECDIASSTSIRAAAESMKGR